MVTTLTRHRRQTFTKHLCIEQNDQADFVSTAQRVEEQSQLAAELYLELQCNICLAAGVEYGVKGAGEGVHCCV